MTTIKQLENRALAALAFTSALSLSLAPAFAAGPAVTSGGTGEQINTMAAEAMNTGGTILGWAATWPPPSVSSWGCGRSGHRVSRRTARAAIVARGVAGLVLCGLFVTGGAWINRASVTAGAGTTTIDGSSSSMVTFH